MACKVQFLLLLVVVAPLLPSPANAFGGGGRLLRRISHLRHSGMPSRGDSDSSDEDSFDKPDFDGSGQLLETLSGRIDEVREKQQAIDRSIAKNWRGAMWSVRGFVMRDVQLSQVVLSGENRLAVGTADGLVYAVDVGSERLAEFRRLDEVEAAENDEVSSEYDGDGVAFSEYKKRLRLPPPDSLAAMEKASREVDDAITTASSQSMEGVQQMSQQPAPLIREDEYKADHDYDKGGSPFKILAEYGGPLGGVHDGPVTALVWDGSFLISGGQDGTVGVWRNSIRDKETRENQVKQGGNNSNKPEAENNQKGIRAETPAVQTSGDETAEVSEMLRELRDLKSTMEHVSAVAADASHADPPDIAEQITLPVHLFQAGHEGMLSAPSPIVAVALVDMHRNAEHCFVAVLAASGRLTLWDANTGKLASRPVNVAAHSSTSDQDGDLADADASLESGSNVVASSLAVLNDLGVVAVGTARGRVVCYDVEELLDLNATTGASPLHSFRAHEPGTSRASPTSFNNPSFCGSSFAGVTAMFSSPPSSSPSNRASAAFEAAMDPALPGASVLLTGGADGIVKQWELFYDKKADGVDEGARKPKLRHFPQLSSQKLHRRVSVINAAHGGAPIVALSGDNSKIISASAADGSIRAFSRTGDTARGRARGPRRTSVIEIDDPGKYSGRGTECLFSMEGFNGGLSSLSFDQRLLACDGMGSTLCLHDFSEIDGSISAASLDVQDM